MSYPEVALTIVKKHIKSAIFIDEKARPFYSSEDDYTEYEGNLSKSLYENFKLNGISLSVHKFVTGDEVKEDLKKYLFEGRDLVLLDWNLDGQEGSNYSLKMLSDVISKNNIHFCAIYTSNPRIDFVYENLHCYFSGKDEAYFIELEQKLTDYEYFINPILSEFDIFKKETLGRLIPKLKTNDSGINLVDVIKDATKESNIFEALKLSKFALNKSYHKSNIELIRPSLISPETNSLVLDNTLITIIQKNKEEEADVDSSSLIERFSNQISLNKESFTQLLGFEMQSIFSQNSSFIDSNLLKISREALLAHRKSILLKDNSDIPFKHLIKDLLIEHASMSLRAANLTLLEKDFLDSETEIITENPSDDALFYMNVFYNSIESKSLVKSLNFGDVFVDDKHNYYICITALCDCYRPSKIQNNFYFAKGNPIKSDLALKMGDSAFVSFLPNGKVVSWINLERDESEQIIKKDDSTSSNELEKIKNELLNSKLEKEYFEQFIYKPVYIKPHLFHVTDNIMLDNKIEITRIETLELVPMDFTFKILEYVTTIRPNYAQRIANHAFGHPVRVGVDFVKK